MTIATSVEQSLPHALPDDLVADHVACQLRSSRLTVLYGSAAHSVSQFIATSLVPRLGRRQWDRSLTRVRQDPFTRALGGRTCSRQSGGSAELPVLVDQWTACPIAALQARINDSFESAGAYMTSVPLPIADSLSGWSRLLDVRFLIIFDRFDDFLARCAESDEERSFTGELVQVLREPGLPVSFLFCAAASSEPRLQRYLAGLAEPQEAGCARLPLHRSSVPPSVSDLTLIEWREPPRVPEGTARYVNRQASGNRPLRASGGLRAACAATMMALALFCWPVYRPDIHFDAAAYLTLAARAVERSVSELVHRIGSTRVSPSAFSVD
jgi:hypothetical protein